ncbi:GNAT family N-acetyltransferase [Paenibacillus sp. J2TS4]|uniref:GNAT family N-acetyltransferase n=1 Tax=Paenibacillus sp. J2TS4 TaxID=2807194 RepID=UPI001B0FB157|nr:GNAT family N-acetyltransferase [Paenibacillus sp. J2TS4]GIP36054.1 N-acetyltransferase [Paenibacillus sp. J2TS4]
MKIQLAEQEDFPGWLELASEVEELFGPMVDDPNFIQALEKSINRSSAFCVRENEGGPGSRLLGGMLFSSSHAPSYKIGWLAVSTHSRNKGVATALLNHILTLVEIPSEISVITFGEDNPGGQPARKFYRKFGFVPTSESVPDGPEGGSRQKFQLFLPRSDDRQS